MTDCPQTYEEVVEWFTKPRRDGSVTHDKALLRELLDGMQARPAKYDDEMRPSKTWNIILEYGLLCIDANFGWVRPDGVFLGCAWACHERLLHYLGLSCDDAENLGWARIGRTGYQCLWRLTRKQIAVIESKGILVDKAAERLKKYLTNSDALFLIAHR